MKYQVGGSLRSDEPTYVSRQADEKLYHALHTGEFCYIFNSRQMGKSSLLQRTSYRLKQEGYQCLYLDVTRLGSEQITSAQWYKGVIVSLLYGLNLEQSFNLKSWWLQQAGLSQIQQLTQFVEEILLPKSVSDRIFIFIDEIDSLLSLKFPVNDFFAWIRHCYNQRAMNPEYNRLGFALFGVASPSDLISDKRRTPFNIGTAIELYGFQLQEATPLLTGLKKIAPQSDQILREIIYWTGGQPFLTQKLCQIVWQTASETVTGTLNLPPRTETYWVEQIVRTHIIKYWESQDEPEHFRTIRARLLYNEKRSGSLLGLYQQVLQAETTGYLVQTDDSPEQTELLLSGIVEKYNGCLRVKNPIYRSVFSHEWVTQQLDQLRPYASLLNAWVASGYQDESRLLRGLALQEALAWTQHKTLSNLDYKFLAASQELDHQEIQQKLETERLKEIEKRLAIERQNSRRIKWLLSGVTIKFLIAVALGVVAFTQYRQATLSEIQALTSASNGSFNSNQHLDALVQAIKARSKLQKLNFLSLKEQTNVGEQTNQVLEQAVYGADEINRLSAYQGGILAVNFSPDGRWLVSGGTDRTVRIWQRDGTLTRTLQHKTAIHGVQFSPDSQRVATAGLDGVVRLWSIDGQALATLKGHTAAVWNATFSPNGQQIASASADQTIKLWRTDGTLLRTLKGHKAAVWKVAFSPDGEKMVSCSVDHTIKLWSREGRLLKTISVGKAAVWGIDFSPDGQTFVSSGADKLIRLWTKEGKLLKTLSGHTAEVLSVAFSADGQMIISASADKTVKLWRIDGTLLRTLQGHQSPIRSAAFSPDGKLIASASEDGTVKLWKIPPFSSTLYGHQDVIWRVAYGKSKASKTFFVFTVAGQELKLWRSDGSLLKTVLGENNQFYSAAFSTNQQTIALAGTSGDLQFFNLANEQMTTLRAHKAAIFGLAYSPDGQFLVSGGDDFTIKLWQRNPSGQFQLRQTIKAHLTRIWDLTVSPDGQFVASASVDGVVKLWTWQDASHLNEKPYRILQGHQAAIWGVAISPDSQYIASSGRDGKLLLWNREGKLIRSFDGGKIGLTRVAFSPNGQLIAAAGLDNTVKIWSINGRLLATLNGHTAGVLSVAFSPDGKTLASSGYDQTAITWNLQKILNLDLMKYGCNWVADYLKTNTNVEKSAPLRGSLRDRHICSP